MLHVALFPAPAPAPSRGGGETYDEGHVRHQ